MGIVNSVAYFIYIYVVCCFGLGLFDLRVLRLLACVLVCCLICLLVWLVLGWGYVACLASGFVGWGYVVSFVLFCSCGAWCCGELFVFVVVCGLVGLVLGRLVLIAVV